MQPKYIASIIGKPNYSFGAVYNNIFVFYNNSDFSFSLIYLRKATLSLTRNSLAKFYNERKYYF